MTVYEQAHAKINLSLDVLGRRENGYHEVKMIMQTLNLCDDLTFEKLSAGEGVRLYTNSDMLNAEQASGTDNLIIKAAKKLSEYTNQSFDVKITLNKYIPIAAGMAGGSADAAATLRGLNKLFELGLSVDALKEIAVKIGADVPFCVTGGLALSEGIGEILTQLSPLPSLPVVICKPNVFVSTKDVYQAFDSEDKVNHPDVDRMVDAIKKYDYKTVVSLMGNVLEPVTVSTHPVISEIEKAIEDNGALRAMMSGSGPTVFGLFESVSKAQEAALKLKAIYPEFDVEATAFHNLPKEHFE